MPIKTKHIKDSAVTSAKIAASTIAASDISTGGVGAANLTTNLKKGFINLPLSAAREVVSDDYGVNATTPAGGILTKDTTPNLERINGATDKKTQLEWAATNVDAVMWDFAYPPDLDDTAALTVNFLVKSGGSNDTPVLTVSYFEGVGDTNAGGNTAAITSSVTQRSVTIAAADIGAYPNAASVSVLPGAHGTDTVVILGAWIEYTRKD